jgi:beta-lactam-binding protein with PASTA domain
MFAITTATNRLVVNADGNAETTFTVTNNTSAATRATLRAKPLDGARQEWLAIAGESERQFSPGGTQQVSVKVHLPSGTPAGAYGFRLDAVSVTNPDEDYTEGPAVAVALGVPAPAKPFPWWLLIAACAVLLVGSVVTWALIPSKVDLPSLENGPADKAHATLQQLGLTWQDHLTDANVTEKTVMDQDPKAGRYAKGTLVQLTIAQPVEPFPMPDYKGTGQNINVAEEALSKKFVNLKKLTTPSTSPVGQIVDQLPLKDSIVKPGDTVTLTFAVPLVPVALKDVRSESAAQAKSELENSGFNVVVSETEDPSKTNMVVFDQSPKPGTAMPGTTVTLSVAYTMVTLPPGLAGLPWTQAKAQLGTLGVSVWEVHGTCGPTSVINASPALGQRVRMGAAITLFTPGDSNKVCYRAINFVGRWNAVVTDKVLLRGRQ